MNVDHPDSGVGSGGSTLVPTTILLWSIIGILAHGVLALMWLLFSWVPWIIPFRAAQVAISCVGIGLHAFAFPMVITQRWWYPQFLKLGGGTLYLLFGIILFVGSVFLSSALVREDEIHYRQSLDRLEALLVKEGTDQPNASEPDATMPPR
ncbi:MAG: hypothetical protein AAF958_13810 [Planctomycetota bacterium]